MKTVTTQCPKDLKTLCDENTELRDKLAQAMDKIKAFTLEQAWASEDWKKQPHIKPLFDLVKEY